MFRALLAGLVVGCQGLLGIEDWTPRDTMPEGVQCAATAECPEGTTCSGGQCRTTCDSLNPCLGGQECTDGICVSVAVTAEPDGGPSEECPLGPSCIEYEFYGECEGMCRGQCDGPCSKSNNLNRCSGACEGTCDGTCIQPLGEADAGCPGILACWGDDASATCDDGIHNGDETDIDCGGSCQRCEIGMGCQLPEDCIFLTCTEGQCTPPYGSCTPGERRCFYDWVQICDGRGLWMNDHQCESGICQGGACQRACAPEQGYYGCSGESCFDGTCIVDTYYLHTGSTHANFSAYLTTVPVGEHRYVVYVVDIWLDSQPATLTVHGTVTDGGTRSGSFELIEESAPLASQTGIAWAHDVPPGETFDFTVPLTPQPESIRLKLGIEGGSNSEDSTENFADIQIQLVFDTGGSDAGADAATEADAG
jgi:hypothetical protein